MLPIPAGLPKPPRWGWGLTPNMSLPQPPPAIVLGGLVETRGLMLSVKQSIMHVEGVVALGNEQIARQRGLVVLLEMRGQESASARQSLLMLRRDSGNALSNWND